MTESKSAKWAAIVLAAGLGTRFGGGKLTATYQGRPLIAGALACALASPATDIVIAIGDDPDLGAAVLAADPAERLRQVRIANPAAGLGASLAATARAIPDDLDGVFVFLGDMPLVPPSIPVALAAALTGPDRIIAPVYRGQRGHPVLFGGDWIPALRRLDGDSGAQALIRRAGDRFIAIETDDPGVLFDVDLPDDLARDPRT